MERFETAYPGVKVNMQISPQIGDIIRPQIVAGNVPNFISMNDNDQTGVLLFILALVNTAKLMAVVPAVTIAFGVVLAYMISQSRLKERGLYRAILYFPNIISLTVVGIIWPFVFHPNLGIINNTLRTLGLESLARPWLGDSRTALGCIAATLVWQATGYYMVMHTAAMDGISPEIYEAAKIGGTGAWRRLISITAPLIKDIIGITFVLALSGTLNLSFTLSKVMTGGGPNGASSVLLQYM